MRECWGDIQVLYWVMFWGYQRHTCGHCFNSLDTLENYSLFSGKNIEKQSPEADFPEPSVFRFLHSSTLCFTVGSDMLK